MGSLYAVSGRVDPNVDGPHSTTVVPTSTNTRTAFHLLLDDFVGNFGELGWDVAGKSIERDGD
jgi:hypothetical protein